MYRNNQTSELQAMLHGTFRNATVLLYKYDAKMPSFTFSGGRKQTTTKFSFSLISNPEYGSQEFKSRSVCLSELVGIIAMKIERTQIHFLRNVFLSVAASGS